MGWFSSNDEKSTLARNPVNVDVTKQYGSGAEQDRYGQHFSNVGNVVGEKIKEGVQELRSTKSSGAEQDRFAARFSGSADQARDAARSGYEQAKDAASSGYNQARDAAERGYDQAKNAAHRGYDKAKEAVDKAINAKGSGAEQDRYGSHFDYSTLDLAPVTRAALSIISKGGNLGAASSHGLGHDGWERAKYLAAYKGAGAEQDRYEARFGGFGQQAGQAIKDEFNKLKR